MQQTQVYPGSTACTMVERCRYDWRGSEGYLETYVLMKDGKCYRVRYNDITHPVGSPNQLEVGWEKPQQIDEHRYATALQAPFQGPRPNAVA